MCDSVGKADLMLDQSDSKQSRESVDLPLTCHPSPSLITFYFRCGEAGRLLLDFVTLWWHWYIGYVTAFSLNC